MRHLPSPRRAGWAQVFSDAGMWGIVAGAVLLALVLALAGATVGQAAEATRPPPFTDRV